MKNKVNISKILNFIGIVLFIITFIILCYGEILLQYICLLFLLSSFLMLPDSLLFTIKKYKDNERFGVYWISKFFGLIIAIIVFTAGFFIILNNG